MRADSRELLAAERQKDERYNQESAAATAVEFAMCVYIGERS